MSTVVKSLPPPPRSSRYNYVVDPILEFVALLERCRFANNVSKSVSSLELK